MTTEQDITRAEVDGVLASLVGCRSTAELWDGTRPVERPSPDVFAGMTVADVWNALNAS